MRQPKQKQRMAGDKVANVLGPMTMQEQHNFVNMATSKLKPSPGIVDPMPLTEQKNLSNMQGSYQTRYY